MLVPLCCAVLIVQLDTSVINLAARPIGHHFGVGVTALQWVIDSSNLTYAILLLSGGLLADLFGRRRIFLAGTGVFVLASMLCAFSPSIPVLTGARALIGLGAALLIPASLAMIRVVWTTARERGTALGIWTGCNGLALAIGPILGGDLLQHLGWRSIFFVSIPIGVAALVLAPFCLPETADPQGRRFDGSGQLLGALALGGLAVAAIESRRLPGVAAAALGLAVVAVVGFIRIERRIGGDAALVPLDLFAVPSFRGAMVATAGMTFGMYGVLFLLPLVWLGAGTFGPVGAGLALMPMALGFVAVSPFSGRLAAVFGARLMMSGGVGVISSGLILIGAMAVTGSIAATEVGLGLTGVGMGLATGPLMGAAVGAVSAARSGSAASLINVARIVGATLGVATLGAVFAAAQAGSQGLRWALFLGGGVQLAGAWIAWRGTRRRGSAER